jgi:hypothetical protein
VAFIDPDDEQLFFSPFFFASFYSILVRSSNAANAHVMKKDHTVTDEKATQREKKKTKLRVENAEPSDTQFPSGNGLIISRPPRFSVDGSIVCSWFGKDFRWRGVQVLSRVPFFSFLFRVIYCTDWNVKE